MDFKKTLFPGYRMPLCQVQTMEQTQDLRLSDSDGDIGNILGCWGQILLRSKEWHGDGVSVSGGVMAWVLYNPEDGGLPVTVESWIPFQMNWDMQDVLKDGSLMVIPALKSIDARNVSARKMVIRANISILIQAIEPVDAYSFQPEKLPEDVYVKKQAFPMEIPSEADEMSIQIDEEVKLPENQSAVHKIVYYHLEPIITESRILSDKLLYRGKLKLHLLYLTDSGSFQKWEAETGFSKYTQLKSEHESVSSVRLIPVLTGAELDVQQSHVQIKSSLAAQYIIYDRHLLELVSDAYSPVRDVTVNFDRMDLLSRLDSAKNELFLEQSSQFHAQNVIDVTCYRDHVKSVQRGDMLQCELAGFFQVLCTDENGLLQGHTLRADNHFQIPSDNANTMCIYPGSTSSQEMYIEGDSIRLKAGIDIVFDTFSCNGIEMVSSVNISEAREPDPTRPSVILRKIKEEQLWDLAKDCGSSVEAIREVNQLPGEPQSGQILLIPVQ